jgi:hypothetical protein
MPFDSEIGEAERITFGPLLKEMSTRAGGAWSRVASAAMPSPCATI